MNTDFGGLQSVEGPAKMVLVSAFSDSVNLDLDLRDARLSFI